MKNENPEYLSCFSAFRLPNIYSSAMLLLLSFTFSCHKEPPHPKPGPAIVVDAYSGKPLAFVKLVAAINNTGTAWGAQTVASTLSDSTGHFWFPDFIPEGDVNYELHASKMHYVSGYNTSFNASTYNGDLIVKMIPYGYVNLFVPKSNNKVKSIHIQGHINYSVSLNEKWSDTAIVVPTIGNADCNLWVVIRNTDDTETDYKETLYVPALDTTNYYVKL